MRRSTPVLLLMLLALLGLAPTAFAAADPPPDRAVRQLDVLSFNIHHAEGPDETVDLDRVAAEIRDSGADVVGMQEVDRHWSERSHLADQPAELARRLGMHVAYGANLDREPATPGGERRQYGTAVLSRFPIVSRQNTPLPKGGPAEEQRGLLEVVLDVHGVPVRVLNTHLQHDSAESRLLQAREVAAAVERSAEPVVLTGDLNATPDAPEITTLTALLTDSHEAGAGIGHTYPVEAPDRRIDYVLAERSRFLGSEVLPTASSDHRPVLARLLVNGKS
ncbi:endonuclease/exonuclease/phosphatase family protein [Pseudonocardia nigra]|uniref:endonuclease/exonuclease/phosphatase family protein n=1 Tax=Pseudonocardia nigra TaxID=1921578 RepID=UPI001C5EDC72|nr:endonuclease/exonuclease/phosphatase family protein [Pseudonocardia nigra]